MTIQIQRISIGQVGVSPGDVALFTSDSLDTIVEAGYISNNTAAGPLLDTDIVRCIYGYTTGGGGTFGIFTVSVSNGISTLVPWVDDGNVLLPVTAGNFALYNNTTGQLENGPAPSNASDAIVAMSPGSLTAGNILLAGDANGSIANGPVAGNKILTSSITTPDVNGNFVAFDITCGFAALASAGHIPLIVSSGSKQYKIRHLYLNSGGTNFSGGSGDRLGQVTDGTTVFSVVPAATLQTLVNAQWGATALPNPASAAINTSTVAGANLYFAYSGGTLDYTAGSVVISGIAQRVA